MSVRARTVRVVPALIAEAVLLLIDVLSDPSFAVRSGYVLPVLAVAVRGAVRDVVFVGAVAFGLVLLTPLWNHDFDQDYVLPVLTVAAGSVIAVWFSRERAAAETERRQMALLAEVARITGSTADVDAAISDLADLLVPDFADAAWVDVLDDDGGVRRLVARIDGPDAPALQDWMVDRSSRRAERPSPTYRVLQGDGSSLVELNPAALDEFAVDAEDRRQFEQSGLRWVIAVPLVVGGLKIGALGVAVGRSGRVYDARDLGFAEVLAGRIALVLRNAELVADLSATQRRLDGILGTLAEAVTVHDERGQTVYANQAAADLLGSPSIDDVLAAEPGELSARFDQRHADGSRVSVEEYPGRRIVRGLEATPMLTRSVRRADGRAFWLVTKATLLHDEDGRPLAVNIIEDVTEEREAELRQAFLAKAGQALASSLDYEQTLQRVARLAVPGLADWCGVDLPDADGVLQQVAVAHVDPEKVAMGRAFRERYPPDPADEAGSYAVLRSGEPKLYPVIPQELLVAAARDEEHLQLIMALQMRSAMAVPMIAGGRTLGVMSFVAAESGRTYTPDDLRFAQELATRAATAVENSRLYTELSTVADTLQASLLPDTLPELAGWEAAADYRPGQRGADVGGDFYDVFPVADGHMLILGDVTGKGVTAAALTSLVRHTAKTAALFDPRPGAVLELVNRVLRQQHELAPVTMVCGVLRPGEISLAVAGHPLPLLKRESGPPERVGMPGLLLGAIDAYPPATERTVRVGPGETLLFFTDGVTDTPGPKDRFGEQRLADAILAAPADATALLERLSAELDAFQRGTVADDRAMLALRWRGPRLAAVA